MCVGMFFSPVEIEGSDKYNQDYIIAVQVLQFHWCIHCLLMLQYLVTT